jgi:succinate dehydrogenase / fumarate reductase cytochrome b subunit
MTWKQAFTSSVGKKLVMGITGISLILFLIVHVGLNACIWADDNGEMFNKGAHFMGTTIVVRILEIGLFAGIILHLVQGYILTAQNNSRRDVKYAVDYGNKGSKWYSRSMGLLGTLILLFLIMHIYHFWTPSRLGGMWNVKPLGEVTYGTGFEMHNLYAEMLNVFQDNLLIVVLYVLGVISLFFHLLHGFHAAFRTLGVHNRKYAKMLRNTGYGFSFIVCLGFAMMPVSMYLGWVK